MAVRPYNDNQNINGRPRARPTGLCTVVDADVIVVMDGGRIIDHGKHEELLKRCEVYRTLTQTQLRPPMQ